MRSRKSRTFLSLFLAVVFAIAAMPGSMATPAPVMPAPVMPSMAGMEHCPGMAADSSSPCDKSHQDQGQPCKNMAACMGMLSCFGMGAVDVSSLAAPPAFSDPAFAIAHQSISGLTLTPDNPPPIA